MDKRFIWRSFCYGSLYVITAHAKRKELCALLQMYPLFLTVKLLVTFKTEPRDLC